MSRRKVASDVPDVKLDNNLRIPFDGKLNFEFGNYSRCLSQNPEVIECLKKDCLSAFETMNDEGDDVSVDSTDYHNSGSTYFQRSDQIPRCCLEELALSIFHFHAKDAAYVKEISGAEWWTQVVDSSDDIGFHWDRDYGHEGKTGCNLYPHLATVTYLTDIGGPTIIVNKTGCKSSEQSHSGPADSVIVSKPSLGKHIKFDGRLLHAAPSSLILGNSSNENQNEIESKNKSKKIIPAPSIFNNKRITFLVNIWLNHIPIQAKAFPVESLKRFSPLFSKSDISSFDQSCAPPMMGKKTSKSEGKMYDGLVSVDVKSIPAHHEMRLGTLDLHRWNFLNGGHRYRVSIPLPSTPRIMHLMKTSNAFNLHYTHSGVEALVELIKSPETDGNSSEYYPEYSPEHSSEHDRSRKRKRVFWRPAHLF